ncbi:unnamed protein product [Closterium sp. Naga37s-1]|nr:unnamed protein product [Closterium sp. Naga37s-1]
MHRLSIQKSLGLLICGPPSQQSALEDIAECTVGGGEGDAAGAELPAAVVHGGEAAHAGGEAAHAGGEAAHAGGEAAHAGGEAAHAGGEAAHAGGEAAHAGLRQGRGDEEIRSMTAASMGGRGEEGRKGVPSGQLDASPAACLLANVWLESPLLLDRLGSHQGGCENNKAPHASSHPWSAEPVSVSQGAIELPQFLLLSPAACLTCCMPHLLHASPAACVHASVRGRLSFPFTSLTSCPLFSSLPISSPSCYSPCFCSPRFSPLPFPLPIILSRLLPPTRLSSIWLPSTLSPPPSPLPCTPNPPLMSPFYYPPCPPSHPPLTQPNPPPSRTPPSPLPALCPPNPTAATARLSCSTHPPRLSRQHHQSASPSPPHTHALPRRCLHPLILRVSPRSPTGGPPCALHCARPLTLGARSFPFPLSRTSPPLRLPVLPSSALQLPQMLSLPRLLLSLAPLPPNTSHSPPHSHFSPPLPVPPLPAPPFLPPPRDRPPVIAAPIRASFPTSANFRGGGDEMIQNH